MSDKCKSCEHEHDSSTEYCGTCSDGVESNWKEANWIKDMRIARLTKTLEAIAFKSCPICGKDRTAQEALDREKTEVK